MLLLYLEMTGRPVLANIAGARTTIGAYRLRDVIYDNGTICIPIIHWRQRFVSFLSRSVPYFKLHGRVFVKSDGLGKEGGTNGGLSIVIELILFKQVSRREIGER